MKVRRGSLFTIEFRSSIFGKNAGMEFCAGMVFPYRFYFLYIFPITRPAH